MITEENIVKAFQAALKSEMKKKGHGGQVWLANQIGVTPQYVYKLQKGRSAGTEQLRRRIAAVFGYGYETFLDLGLTVLSRENPHEGLLRSVLDITPTVLLMSEVAQKPDVPLQDYYAAPLIDGKIAAGEGRIIGEGDVRSLVWIYAPALRNRRTHRLIAVEVDKISGDSMTPTIFPGDIVLVDSDEPDGDSSSLIDGKIYAIRDGKGGCAVKRIYRSSTGFIVSSDNRDVPPQIAWTGNVEELIIGRVVWGWRNLMDA